VRDLFLCVKDYFETFDLPRNLAIDPKDLEKRFYALSRQLHPDLHSRKSPAEREQAEEATATLNDAYRTLRDPVKRAEYLLKLEGFDIGEQTSKDVPAELLEEVFELNMALEELRAGDTDALPQLDAARDRFDGMRGEVDREMEEKFAEWDRVHERVALTAVRRLLNRRKYITNLIAQTHVPDRV
jgi:molecular chaperone HscB